MSSNSAQEMKNKIDSFLERDIQAICLQSKEESSNIYGFEGNAIVLVVQLKKTIPIYQNEEATELIKTIHTFISGIIDILKQDTEKPLVDIHMKDNNIVAIYNTDTDVKDLRSLITQKTILINTFVQILNKSLKSNKLAPIQVSIGVDESIVFGIKTHKDFGNNNLFWIGKAYNVAEKCATIGKVQVKSSILLAEKFYLEYRDKTTEQDEHLFKEAMNSSVGSFYHMDVVTRDYVSLLVFSDKDK